MKKCLLILLTLLQANAIYTLEKMYSVELEPKWEDLELCKKHNMCTGKWILYGSIIFKKKLKDTVKLEKLHLQWEGPRIDQLSASLYRKHPDKDFLAIEDNLVCDSEWNRTTQTLILNFDCKQTLGPLSVFYLVLTVPESLEKTIKQGKFFLQKEILPYEFKQTAEPQQLTLAHAG